MKLVAVVLRKGYPDPVPVPAGPVTSAWNTLVLVAVMLLSSVPFTTKVVAVGKAPLTRSKVMVAGWIAKSSSVGPAVVDALVEVVLDVLLEVKPVVVVDIIRLEVVVVEMLIDAVLTISKNPPATTVLVELEKGAVGKVAVEFRPDNRGGPGIV